MPVQECSVDDRPGYRWGQSGKCYTYEPGDSRGRAQAKLKAFKQGMAIGEAPTGGQMSEVGVITITGAQIDAEGLSWIEVMPTAEKVRNGDWFFTVSADDLTTLADYIKQNPDRIPIDYDHAAATGGSSRAAGWFTGESMVVAAGEKNPGDEVQERASVWAQVKWTPTAVDEIRSGDFRFISPEWHFDAKDPKSGLMTKLHDLAAATLTNRPFFKDLAPVRAELMESEQVDALTDKYGSEVAELALAAWKTEDEALKASLEQVLDAVKPAAGGNPSAADQGEETRIEGDPVSEHEENGNEKVTDYMRMLGLDETVDPKHRLAAAFREKDEKILALEQQVTDLTSSSSAKAKEADELASRIEELEQKDRARDIEVILARAVEKGRVFPAEKETLAELFASDVNGLKRMIATRPAEMFEHLEPKGGSADPDRYADDADVAQYTATLKGPDPVDTESAKLHVAALQILKDQGKTDNYTDDEYIAACEQASKTLVY